MQVRSYKPVFFAPSHWLPVGFEYPASYIRFAETTENASIGSGDQEWSVIDEAEMQKLFEYVRVASSGKPLVPFMRSYGDQASVACFSPEPTAPVYQCSLVVRGHCIGGRITFSQWASEVAGMGNGNAA